jgi:hypothetical protein
MRAFILTVLFLVGCTSYNAGVESNWARPNVLLVSGSGNAFSTDGRIEDYVFLQAAEKALEAGYRYYVVAESVNTGGTETFTTYSPYTTTISGSTRGSYIGNSYNSNTYATATTTGGPQSYTYYFPGREAIFKMFDTKPQGYRPGQYYDVVEVYNDLGPKYLSDFQPIDVTQLAESETPLMQQDSTPVQSITSVSFSDEQPAPLAAQKVSRPKAKRERSLDELYQSLSDDEKFIADSMSPTERVQYLYSNR